MSEAYRIMMEIFFQKKEKDMRKPHLRAEYLNIVWNEVRNYASGGNGGQQALEDVKIT